MAGNCLAVLCCLLGLLANTGAEKQFRLARYYQADHA